MFKNLLFAAALLLPISAQAATLSYVGISLSGGEDGVSVGTNDNTYGYDYIYPAASEVDYFHSLGFTFIRIPFFWERLQPNMDGPLSTTQLGYIETAVAEAARDKMGVILDSHDYGQGWSYDIGSTGTPAAAFVNYWTAMATAFKGYSNVVFALNNEPHDQSAAAWETIEQAVITGIRSTGATQEILASGVGWDGGESWVGDGNDVLSELSDPLKKTVIEVHQYLDPGNSGTSCTIASQAAADLSGVTAWAAGAGLKLWLGEIGVCSDTTSLAALMATMGYLNTNSNVWQGMTYWAGGPWMDAYMYSADASSAGVASAQAAALLAAWK